MLCAHNVIIVKMDWLVYALRLDRGLVKVYPLALTLYYPVCHRRWLGGVWRDCPLYFTLPRTPPPPTQGVANLPVPKSAVPDNGWESSPLSSLLALRVSFACDVYASSGFSFKPSSSIIHFDQFSQDWVVSQCTEVVIKHSSKVLSQTSIQRILMPSLVWAEILFGWLNIKLCSNAGAFWWPLSYSNDLQVHKC